MNSTAKFAQPTLADLTARFLARPADRDDSAAVQPHEMPAGFATEPRTAWTEATAIAKWLGLADIPSKLPVDWAGFVRQSASVDYLPMALGHFPQQVQDVSALLANRPTNPSRSAHHGWTATSGKSNFVNQLLNAASERVAANFDEANRLLGEAESLADDAAKQSILANERAALAWQRGDRTAAEAIWNAQPTSGPIAFNRGVSALSFGRKTEALQWLTAAVQQLPESSGWHHLAQLYLALAQ